MTLLRSFLSISTVIIFAVSIYVIFTFGFNWPAIYFGDLLKLDWRSQFNTDLFIYISLITIWVMWREGFTQKGFLFGFLNFVCGAMFACPYLLFATYKANGDLKSVLLGKQTN
ncbi:hypothetical protein VB774_13240 [Pseudanabaena galeata UHCC 0370]|uniref:DUF2834 domain-containing protein n=1 Tax=Pseudanabaena galeata UHCC 0370 TaxID=3110310 RepID=A0ABU5TKG4_9CYAN|nr:hypothetical protein [Pseudanabaena galeata]MEA5478587.1 hypothetical protein [Pseudanabaena galeata UHCC 0370]